MVEVKDFCLTWASHQKIELLLRGQSLTAAEAFSEAGLLPSVAKRADQLASLTLGYGIGVKLEDKKESTLGVEVSFDNLTPALVRISCFLHVLEDLRASATNSSGKLVLDELLYD